MTRSCSRFRDVIRLGVLAYLAVVLGAGAALRNVHLESSEHGHRYCLEHEQFEAIEHGDEGHSEALVADREVADPSSSAVENAERSAPRSHVACAVMNGLSSRTTAIPNTRVVFVADVDTPKPVIAIPQRNAAFDSILFVAPKTSPPASAA